ncbi:MAG: Hsp20/alpha crystallin family protein [Gemmatimonadota bacterium]|jgi:HSP20 family protein|nr:Hsp20/alpha crystallin family protein [Gemmatimonadota bacterium]
MRIVKAAPVMAKVRNDIDQVFDRLFHTTFAPGAQIRTPNAEPAAWMPPFDLLETEAEYIVRLDVPGAHRENLDITLTGTLLTLSGRREFLAAEPTERYLLAEREVGEFHRMIRLPTAVVQENITATYQDGVLLVHLPKVPSAVTNKILIK